MRHRVPNEFRLYRRMAQAECMYLWHMLASECRAMQRRENAKRKEQEEAEKLSRIKRKMEVRKGGVWRPTLLVSVGSLAPSPCSGANGSLVWRRAVLCVLLDLCFDGTGVASPTT